MYRKLIPILSLALLLPVLLGPAGASTAATNPEMARILIGFEKGTSTDLQRAIVAQVDGKRLATVPRLKTAVVSVPAAEKKDALAELERAPGVAYAEPDRVRRATATPVNDPLLNHTHWQFANPGFDDAWDLTKGDSNLIVAVIDTGVKPDHPDLGVLVPGQNYVTGPLAPDDDNGHGTAVAGVIAARTNNGQGIAGVCWNCRIMPVKVMDSDGYGSDSWVSSGIIWAVDHGAHVLNLSLGGSGSSETLKDAVAYARAHGVVVVAAAGNFEEAESGIPPPSYPAAYPGVISVGAIGSSSQRYSFSYFGEWVEVDAPGCTTAAALGTIVMPETFYTEADAACGTSFAAPYVSGLAALALSYRPQALETQVLNAITGSATTLAQGNSIHGAINALPTLNTLQAVPPGPRAAFRPSVTSGTAPFSVKFENLSLGATSYTWSFGDGATSTVHAPTHVYTTPGVYEVTLEAHSTSGDSLAYAVISVSALSPKASFRVNRMTGPAPLRISFQNKSTNASSSQWSFGDGSSMSLEGSPTHLFANPGKYRVTLRSTGPGGSDSANLNITVTESRPDLVVKLARTNSRRVPGAVSVITTVKNSGHAKDENVRLKITLSARTKLHSMKAGSGACKANGRTVTCTLGTVGAGRQVRVWIVAKVSKGSRATASASGHRAETSRRNNKDTITCR